jgi:hypothetical protein
MDVSHAIGIKTDTATATVGPWGTNYLCSDPTTNLAQLANYPASPAATSDLMKLTDFIPYNITRSSLLARIICKSYLIRIARI